LQGRLLALWVIDEWFIGSEFPNIGRDGTKFFLDFDEVLRVGYS
jgi:hypothetical protein